MSASIEYSVQNKAAGMSADDLNSQIENLCGEYSWYIEPAFLFESNGGIVGASKLFRLVDEAGNELAPSDESPKVMKDIDQLVNTLESLSKAFDITWELAIEGAPIGVISEEGPDDMLLQTLAEMLAIFSGDIPDAEPEEEFDGAKLDKKSIAPGPKKPWWKFW